MANIASAKKRIRSTNRKTIVNKNRISKIRTFEKKVDEAIAEGNHEYLLSKSEIYKNFYDKQLRKD